MGSEIFKIQNRDRVVNEYKDTYRQVENNSERQNENLYQEKKLEEVFVICN